MGSRAELRPSPDASPGPTGRSSIVEAKSKSTISPEAHLKLILKKNELSFKMGFRGEIPTSIDQDKIKTCKHEFGHAIVAEKEGIPVKWISANADPHARPPHKGITIFHGKATPAMIAAGAVLSESDQGTGGDKQYLSYIKGGGGHWEEAKAEAREELKGIDSRVLELASIIFVRSGGDGGPEKMHLAFELARIEMQLRNIEFKPQENPIKFEPDKEDDEIKPDRGFETAIVDLVDGSIQVYEHNLITDEVKVDTYFPCCGCKNQHTPDCKVVKRYSKGINEKQNISSERDNDTSVRPNYGEKIIPVPSQREGDDIFNYSLKYLIPRNGVLTGDVRN